MNPWNLSNNFSRLINPPLGVSGSVPAKIRDCKSLFFYRDEMKTQVTQVTTPIQQKSTSHRHRPPHAASSSPTNEHIVDTRRIAVSTSSWPPFQERSCKCPCTCTSQQAAPPQAPGLLRASSQDGWFSSCASLSQVSDETDCFFGPTSPDFASNNHQPRTPAWLHQLRVRALFAAPFSQGNPLSRRCPTPCRTITVQRGHQRGVNS